MAGRDWRRASDYAELAALDLASLAWEFLRRNPDYRDEWLAGRLDEAAAAGWGLRFPLSPDLEAQGAPLFWRPEAAPPHVLLLSASCLAGTGPPGVGEGGGVTARDLLGLTVASAPAAEGLHLRFAHGLQAVLPAGAPADAPLAAVAALDDRFPARLTGLSALERLLRRGPPAPHPLSAQGRARSVQMLRALDGLAQGASYRGVAAGLFGRASEREAWRVSSVRDVAIRLCRAARRLAAGGYRGLLLRRR